jgi:hypothetical protein
LREANKEANGQLEEIKGLEERSMAVLDRLLPMDKPSCIEGLDTLVLFDHMIPIFAGRFVGRELLDRFGMAI